MISPEPCLREWLVQLLLSACRSQVMKPLMGSTVARLDGLHRSPGRSEIGAVSDCGVVSGAVGRHAGCLPPKTRTRL